MNKSSKLLHLDPFAKALERKEKERVAREENASVSSHVEPANKDTSDQSGKNDSHGQVQGYSHTGSEHDSHANTFTPSHVPLSDPSNQVSEYPSELGSPKRRNLATLKARNQATKKSVSRPQQDRHKTRDGQVNVQPEETLLKEVRHFLVDYDMTMKDFFELSARYYMDAVASKLAEGVSSDKALNDLGINNKSNADIVMLYSQYTGNRWKPHDDAAGHQFNGNDIRYIEIGILNTLLRFKGKRINSFKYFVPEIEESLAVRFNEETLEILLARRRQQWETKRGE